MIACPTSNANGERGRNHPSASSSQSGRGPCTVVPTVHTALPFPGGTGADGRVEWSGRRVRGFMSACEIDSGQPNPSQGWGGVGRGVGRVGSSAVHLRNFFFFFFFGLQPSFTLPLVHGVLCCTDAVSVSRGPTASTPATSI